MFRCCFSALTKEQPSSRQALDNALPQPTMTQNDEALSLSLDIAAASPEIFVTKSMGASGRIVGRASSRRGYKTPDAQAVEAPNRDAETPEEAPHEPLFPQVSSPDTRTARFRGKLAVDNPQGLEAEDDTATELVPIRSPRSLFGRRTLTPRDFMPAARMAPAAEVDPDRDFMPAARMAPAAEVDPDQSSGGSLQRRLQPTDATSAGVVHFPSAFSVPVRSGTLDPALWERWATSDKPQPRRSPSGVLYTRMSKARQGSLPSGGLFESHASSTCNSNWKADLVSRGSCRSTVRSTDSELMALASPECHNILQQCISSEPEQGVNSTPDKAVTSTRERGVTKQDVSSTPKRGVSNTSEQDRMASSSQRGMSRGQSISYLMPSLSAGPPADIYSSLPASLFHQPDAGPTIKRGMRDRGAALEGRGAATGNEVTSTGGPRHVAARTSLSAASRQLPFSDFMLAVRAAKVAQSLAASEVAVSERDWSHRSAGHASCHEDHSAHGRCGADTLTPRRRTLSSALSAPLYPGALDPVLAHRWAALGRPRMSPPEPHNNSMNVQQQH